MKKLLFFITLFGISGFNASMMASQPTAPVDLKSAPVEGTYGIGAGEDDTTNVSDDGMVNPKLGVAMANVKEAKTIFDDLLAFCQKHKTKKLDLKAKYSGKKLELKKTQENEITALKQKFIEAWAAGNPLSVQYAADAIKVMQNNCEEWNKLFEQCVADKRNLIKEGKDALAKFEKQASSAKMYKTMAK